MDQTPLPNPTPMPNPPLAPAAPSPAQGTKPPLPGVNQGAKNKRFLYGCCSAFGCALLLFLGVIFVFIGVGGTTENPIFTLFGVSGPKVVNVIIALTNLIFGFLAFIIFIITVIGVFKFATTKKVEKENRKKAALLSFGALSMLILLIFLWIFAYLFLKSKQTPIQHQAIITEPESTIDLTAPVTVKFDATSIPINKRRYQILTYEWDFGDGETRTGGTTQTHQYAGKGKKGGRFDVILTITAREIATGKEAEQQFTRIVTVANEQAQAVIKATPERGEIPLVVAFDASQSFDPDGEIQTYEWDLDEDNDFDDGKTPQINKTFEQVGTYKVVLRLTESDGSFVIAGKTVEALPSNEPVGVITIEGVTDDKLFTGRTYTFTAAQSSSPSGKIVKFEWDFGDGTKKQTRTITYSYAQSGTYEITLRVEDDTGQKAEAVKRVNVTNPAQAPTPVLKTTPAASEGKLVGSVPLRVEFDASESTDPDQDIVEYQWDFQGDGTIDLSDKKGTYTYESVGTFSMALTVIDAAGNSSTSTLEIQVTPPELQANLKADKTDGEVPLTVSFDASGSSFAGHRIVAYEWNFGDGTEQRIDAAKISHQYTKVGAFVATVAVVGDDQKKELASINVSVRPISLKACFSASPETGKAPLDVLFDPSCSAGTVVRYKWDFGGGKTSRDRKPTTTFENEGTYRVKLEVADNANIIDTFEKTITVTE